MRVIITKTYEEMSEKAAQLVASQVCLDPKSKLGLATGSTPLGMYKRLVDYYEAGYIDFAQVETFNLDEYVGLSERDPQSYHYYMQQNLFNSVNIAKGNIHIPDGMVEKQTLACIDYDKKLLQSGGTDIQILGIGENAHIGFNEPSDSFIEATHYVALTQKTIEANSRFFSQEQNVPRHAISMGIKGIMQAKRIILLANGRKKADAIYDLLYGEIKPQIPASILRLHQDLIVIIDEEAAQKIL